MIKVMTLNLNYKVDKHGAWPDRKALIENVIKENTPDIIAFQAVKKLPEAEGGLDQATQISRDLPAYSHIFFKTAKSYENGSADGIAFLSRIPIATVDYQRLTLIPDLEDPNQRVILRARFDLPADALVIYNAHFSWVQEQATLNMEEALPFITDTVDKAILVGDLNNQPDREIWDWIRARGWVDAWEKLCRDKPGYTFESQDPSIRIDYVWANSLAAPTLHDIKILQAENEKARLSDHLGLLVTLNMQGV